MIACSIFNIISDRHGHVGFFYLLQYFKKSSCSPNKVNKPSMIGYFQNKLHYNLCTVVNWIIYQVLIACYILIVGLNYVKSDYLLLTNSNPSGLLGRMFSRMMHYMMWLVQALMDAK
jgi:hypothetical protein